MEVHRAEHDTQIAAGQIRLDQLASDIVETCEIEAQARGCALVLKTTRPIDIRGDAELLRSAIENVLRNAIRYAPPHSSIEVSLRDRDGQASLSIRDFGPGVPDESMAHLCEPFYRIEEDRDRGTGGIGLGLAIAQRAVQLHKGRLDASNARPGLMIEIQLPA